MGSVGTVKVLINRQELDSKLEKSAKALWKFSDEDDFTRQIQSEEVENFKQIATDMLNYLKDNNLSIITTSSDYDDFIEWYYSGKDRQDKTFMSGYTDDYPTKSKLLETLSGNGITPRFILPKNIADYVMNKTNMEPEVMKVADVITTQALKEYKKGRK